MENTVNSFTIAEYLSVFTGFIYGYVATRFFSGWGAMINFRHSIKFSKEHLLWTLLIFGLLIDNWWGAWIKGNYIHKSLLYYISILPALLFYVISVLLFPPLSDDRFLDLRKHYYSIRKRNYLILIGMFITFLINDHFFKRLFYINNYLNGIAILFALIGFLSRSPLIHRSILFIGWIMLIFHIYQQPVVLNDNIDGFSFTEYLTIFIAFVYGSIASRFLTGWGVMISKFNRITFSRDHLAWAFLAFVLLLDFWTGSWPREKFITLNIKYFLLSLLVPVAFYALTAVLFPNIKGDDDIDLRAFYLSHKKIIYLLFGVTMIANTITANLMEQELIHIENLFRLIALTLTAIIYFTKRPHIERAVLIFGWIILIFHTITETFYLFGYNGPTS
jgi:hypothetical protein